MTLNYNYTLSNLIYGITGCSSVDYSTFLKDKSRDLTGRRFKLFTFSNLLFSDYRVEEKSIRFGKCNIDWYISSPINLFMEHLYVGLVNRHFIDLGGVRLDIEKVEELQDPVFTDDMKFTCVSPITVTAKKSQMWKSPHYIRLGEDGFSEAVGGNLIKKYILLHGCPPEDDRLSFEFDNDYIIKRCGKVQKKIRFMNLQIVGIVAPFFIRANPDLIKVGYHCGFGEKGSMGFGMAKIL